MNSRHRYSLSPGWAVWTLFFAALFLTRLVALTDPDVFMHIRSGQWMLEHRSILRSDPFSVFAAGEPWTNHQWLAQIVIAVQASAGGLRLVSVSRALLLSMAFAFLLLAMRDRGVSRWPALSVLFLGALASWGYCAPRPYLASFLGMAWLAWAWAAMRRGEGRRARMLYFAPAVFLIWANMHAGFAAGLLFLGAMVVGETTSGLLEHPGKKAKGVDPVVQRRRRAARLWLLLGGCALAVCINPAGPKILLFWRAVVGRKLLESMILEWNPPALAFDFLAYYVLLGLLAAGFLARPRRIAPADWLAAGGFALMSLTARRHIPLLVFSALPILAEQLEAFRQSAPASAGVLGRLFGRKPASGATRNAQPSTPNPSRLACLPAAGAAVLFIGGLAWGRQLVVREYIPLGLGVHPLSMPQAATKWLNRSPLQPNLFNSFNFGGYLIGNLEGPWRAFTDGRVDVYGPERMRAYIQWLSGRGDWRAAFEQYDINAVMLDYSLDDKTSALGHVLWDDPAWVLVYWDDVAMIFARRDSVDPEAMRAMEYRAANPLMSPPELLRRNPAGPARERLKGELAAATGGAAVMRAAGLHYTSNLRAGTFTAVMLASEGKLDEAEREYRAQLAGRPRSSYLWFHLAEILDNRASEMAGDPKNISAEARIALRAAEDAYRKSADLDPRQVLAFVRLGTLRERQGDLKGALGWYRRANKADPSNGDAIYNEARVLAQLGRDRESILLWEQLTAAGLRDAAVDQGMAELYERLDAPADALRMLKEAQALDPGNEEIARAIKALLERYGLEGGK